MGYVRRPCSCRLQTASSQWSEKVLEVLVPEIGDHIIEVVEVFDERFRDESRRHIFVEYTQLRKLEAREVKILVINADFMDVRWVTELKHFSLHMKPAIH